MDNNKKVILINGTNSNWYEQVIFILKPNSTNKVPIDLVSEAEKIINDYMTNKSHNKNKFTNTYQNNSTKNIKKQKTSNLKPNTKLFNNILNVSIFCCIILIGFLLYKIGF